jgi:hypothetical protein
MKCHAERVALPGAFILILLRRLSLPAPFGFVLLLSLFFSSCIAYNYRVDEAGFIDRSFQATGDTIEQGSIGILKQRMLPFFNIPIGKTRPPESDIAIVGYLQEKTPDKIALKNFKSRIEGELDTLMITGFKRDYRWIGSITMNNQTSELNFRFTGYTPTKDIEHLSFELPETKNGDRIALNRHLNSHKISSFPYPLGSFYIGETCYPLYMVKEIEYALTSSTIPEEKLFAYNPDLLEGDRELITLVFRRDQKFQVVNEARQGVADIQGDSYALYDTFRENIYAQFKSGVKVVVYGMNGVMGGVQFTVPE